MKKKHNADIVLYSKGYFALVAFLLVISLMMLIPCICRYIIWGESIEWNFFLLIFILLIIGGLGVFIYSLYGAKLLVYGNIIVIRKWYGPKKSFNIDQITEIIFEKSKNEIVSMEIITNDSKDKFYDEKVNFDVMKDYLISNISSEKVKCFILGTKRETTL